MVGIAFSGDGARVAVATAEGALHVTRVAVEEGWRGATLLDGAILSLCAHPAGFLAGGDDGGLHLATDGPDGIGARRVASFGGRWVEQVAVHAGPRDRALTAVAAGRRVALLDDAFETLRTLEHPSAVTGLVFDQKGKRICASHVDGASMWFVQAKSGAPRRLAWKGSHIGIAIHPGGEALVTATQENALHGWRLSDSHDMRMSGYPQKTRSLSFSRNGRWLATSGAEAVVLWPFFGGGPMGKPPLELGALPGTTCSAVAFHPSRDVVAAGFGDGAVLVADIATLRLLPIRPSDAAPGGGAVSVLAWSPDGSRLAFGTAAGAAGLVDLSSRADGPARTASWSGIGAK